MSTANTFTPAASVALENGTTLQVTEQPEAIMDDYDGQTVVTSIEAELDAEGAPTGQTIAVARFITFAEVTSIDPPTDPEALSA